MMQKKPIIYLAGRMRGLPDYGRKDFNFIAKTLTRLGYQVINPAALPTGLKFEDYMPICTAMINACDVLVLIDGWEESDGAKLEAAYANFQNKRVVTLDKFVTGVVTFAELEELLC